MKMDDLGELERRVARGRDRLQEIDQELINQLARKKVLDDIFGSSSEQAENTSRESVNESMKSSQKSALSEDSQFIESEIARVKLYMREQGKEQKEEPVDQNERTFKRHNKTKSISLHQQSNHWKQIPKFNAQAEESDLHELSLSFFQKQLPYQNINKIEVQKRLDARNRHRQRQLADQRQQIRNQLIKQQMDRQIKENQNHTKAKTMQTLNHDIDFSSPLKTQRNRQLTRLLRHIQRGKHQNDALSQKIKKAQLY